MLKELALQIVGSGMNLKMGTEVQVKVHHLRNEPRHHHLLLHAETETRTELARKIEKGQGGDEIVESPQI